MAEASWFSIPKLMPVPLVFDLRAIVPVLIMFIVTAVETVGDISGVMEGGMGREATDSELSGGVICDGLGSSFAALFGVLPNTSFSQNVGLVAMTKIVNRHALEGNRCLNSENMCGRKAWRTLMCGTRKNRPISSAACCG